MKTSVPSNFRMNRIFESGGTDDPLDEILALVSLICPTIDGRQVRRVHEDVTAIFSGNYHGFEASITKYHNLRHTYSVVLAAIRLFHGLHHENRRLPKDFIMQGLLSAYFHDSGMLPQQGPQNGQGLTRHHEKRSIAYLDGYLCAHSFPASYRKNCATMIEYTILDWEASADDIGDSNLHLCGQVVGTADLLAQMADRYYLESLPLLFQEHQESGIDQHASAIELMSGTRDFHDTIIKRRLKETLGDLAPTMRTHFLKRWNIDRNLYLDNIALNLDYLLRITEDCAMDLDCWSKYLRRTPPSADD